VPVGFCSPKDELPNPKVFAPLFPNKLEESGEMNKSHEAHKRQYSTLHFVNCIRRKRNPFYLSNPQAQNEYIEKQHSAERS